MPRTVTLSDVLALSVPERIRLVQDIWDSLAEVPDAVTLTDAQRDELDRRLAAYAADTDAGAPWAEVRDRIRLRA